MCASEDMNVGCQTHKRFVTMSLALPALVIGYLHHQDTLLWASWQLA
jgi:hypothetical protein